MMNSHKGVKIYGFPWVVREPQERVAFFCKSEIELVRKIKLIPENIDILISHSPVIGLCDENRKGIHKGSHALRHRIIQAKPKLIICGHIHNGHGCKKLMEPPFITLHHNRS